MDRTRLVITRKSGEAFVVGESRIELKIEGKRIRVIIEAPKEVRVDREKAA